MVLASSLLTQWLDAKADADNADRANFTVLTAFAKGVGPALLASQCEAAARLRQLAGALLQRKSQVLDACARVAASVMPDEEPAQPPPAEVRDPNEPGSRSGEGTSSLNVHIQNDAHRKTDPASRNQNGVERSWHRVLVVDDNPAMRYATARGLRAAGFATVEAGAGAEGLSLAQAASAVVLDIHLPDIDGFEVCRLVRANPATAALPIVHMSAVFVDVEDQDASLNAGADAYLIAPVPALQLVALVDRLISRADEARA